MDINRVCTSGVCVCVCVCVCQVYSWGCNDEGALGRVIAGSEDFCPGVVADELLPLTVLQISTGDSHCAALSQDGTVWAWGIFGVSSLLEGILHGSRGLPL